MLYRLRFPDGLVKERRGRRPKKTPVKKPVTIRLTDLFS